MISAYKPKFASPLPGADPLPVPFGPFAKLAFAGLSVFAPSFSDLWVVGEGVPSFLAVFSSSFFGLPGDLCATLSLALGFGVLCSSALGLAEGLADGFGVPFGLGLGVGLGEDVGLGFGVGLAVGNGVGLGVIGGGVGVAEGFGVGVFSGTSGSGVAGGGVGGVVGGGESAGSGSGGAFSF